MSLKVWLPLNGDLTQQGASEMSITNNGATINDNGKIGKCYLFDGSDDFISLSGNTLYNIFKGGSQQFSICFWVYHNDATRAIIFGDYGLSGAIGFNIELTTSHGVRFYWNGSPDKNFNSTSYVTAQGWTHIVITYSGSILNIYRNGILSTDSWSGTLATKNKTTGQFYLGRDSRTGTTALNGRLNDFRIYDHCLSAAEVREISQGLILHYKLDDMSRGIQDSSGYNHNGIINGTLALSNSTPRYSSCAVFNGTNTKIQVPNLTPAELTISFWMKRNANTGTRQFMYTAWNGITCELQTGGAPTFAVYRTSYPIIVGEAITTASGWVHYCATFDLINGSKLYQNGILKSSNNNVTPIVYNITTNYIGYYNTYYNGAMSDFRIYCTALDADAVRQLYEVGAKIDNKQNLHTFELIENQSSIKVTKQGQVKCDDLTESTTTKFYKSKDINTNNLIEL